MGSNPKIITTGDGSHSLLNEQLNETYHSTHGAVTESQHVFIEQGLGLFATVEKEIRVLEIGFGTGLNAWLALRWAQENGRHLEYTTLETLPLSKEVWQHLNYHTQIAEWELGPTYFRDLHEAPWESAWVIAPHFSIKKIAVPLQTYDVAEADLIFFDAFAPNKQAEMWELPQLERAVSSLCEGGVFVTYCAKGQVRRDLASLGLTMERLPGPPGKKEMLRGTLRK